ncbi:MAG TPA: hypothetical protein VD766_01230 [Solirubrobacterales bacterium]|nr:hypothetical protein [Solirubrobacterales bacterium]
MRRCRKALVVGASLALAVGAGGVAGCSDDDAREQAQEEAAETREDIDEAMEDAQEEVEDGSGSPSY